MFEKIKSFFGGGGGVNITMEGALPVTYEQNWWQRNLKPIGGGGTAIVNACADAYAQTIATLATEHYRVVDSGKHECLKDSALSQVIRRPNSYQTTSDFFNYTAKSLMLNGNSYAVALRDGRNQVVSLHPINPRTTEPMVIRDTGDIFYSVGVNEMLEEAGGYLIPARDILHIKLFTPLHPLRGESPIVHAGHAIMANTAISSQQASFFNNSSRPSGILVTDQNLKENQIKSLREAWEQQSAGLSAGKVPVLFGGLKFQPLSVTSNDAQIVDAFQMTIEDVARAFRVPLPLVGSYKNSTYNNVEQLIGLWLSTGLGFVMENVEQAIERFFRLPDSQHFNFNTDSLLRTDFKGRIEGLTKGVAGGLYSPNEARRMEGLPEVEGGDEPRMQVQNVPLSKVDDKPGTPATPEPPADPTEEEEETAKTLALDFLRKTIDG